jgi:hypothetical protein
MVVPRHGRLVLLGRLSGSIEEQPSSLSDLQSRRGLASPGDPPELAAVASWLVVGGVHSCPALGPGATPCPGPGPLLTDREPMPDGVMVSDLQQPVQVWPGAIGIATGQVVTPGPFLVRSSWLGTGCGDGFGSPAPCLGGPFPLWQVVARYDVAGVYRVDLQ